MTRFPSWQLFALATLIWSTTWHAIVWQLREASPEAGVALRFAIAGAIVLAFARRCGEALPRAPRAHALLALQGVFLYSLSYLGVYHAERHVPSGLVAVGYSASPLLAGVGAWLLWRVPLSARFVAGGVVAIAGVALIFMPELAATGARPDAALGLAFTAAAVALSAVGSLAASRNASLGIAFWPGFGCSMLYGALASAFVWAGRAEPFAWPTTALWWLSLAYLAVAGSVVAFACWLTLQQRIGPGPASTIAVMTPVLALVVSTAFEGFRPGGWTVAGALLAIGGNVLMLRKGRAPAAE